MYRILLPYLGYIVFPCEVRCQEEAPEPIWVARPTDSPAACVLLPSSPGLLHLCQWPSGVVQRCTCSAVGRIKEEWCATLPRKKTGLVGGSANERGPPLPNGGSAWPVCLGRCILEDDEDYNLFLIFINMKILQYSKKTLKYIKCIWKLLNLATL